MNITRAENYNSVASAMSKSKSIPFQAKKESLREIYQLPKGMTIETTKNYYPNLFQISQDELFNAQFDSGVELSDGSKLLRPVILSLGDVEITPIAEKTFKVSVPKNNFEDEKIETIMSQGDLLKNRTLCRGFIKETENGTYRMTFIDINGQKQKIEADKKDCLKILKDNLLYM